MSKEINENLNNISSVNNITFRLDNNNDMHLFCILCKRRIVMQTEQHTCINRGNNQTIIIKSLFA